MPEKKVRRGPPVVCPGQLVEKVEYLQQILQCYSDPRYRVVICSRDPRCSLTQRGTRTPSERKGSVRRRGKESPSFNEQFAIRSINSLGTFVCPPSIREEENTSSGEARYFVAMTEWKDTRELFTFVTTQEKRKRKRTNCAKRTLLSVVFLFFEREKARQAIGGKEKKRGE